jgi:hypothetical protein
MRLPMFARGLLLALIPIVLSGCELLIPSFYGISPTEPNPYPIPSFGADVTYTSGNASLELTEGATKTTIALDELVDGSQTFGVTTATWRGPDGWSLGLAAFSMGDAAFADNKMVTIQRINGNDLWVADTTFNPSACTVVLHELTDKRIQGNATCRNLRWADGFAQGEMSLAPPKYIEGQDPFSVDITFEATAKAGQVS